MAESTVYDVRLRYMMEDRATKGLNRMTKATDRASRSSRGLGMGFGKLAALGAGAFGLHKAGKALIGFNADMEQARIQMAGLLMGRMGGTFNKNMERSVDLVTKLQERAKASVGTTKDYVDMAAMIVGPVSAAGLGMKDLEDITSGAVVSAKAFGFAADVAARDIRSALVGQVTAKDQFIKSVLEPMLKKMGGPTIAQFGKLSKKQQAEILKNADLTRKEFNKLTKQQKTATLSNVGITVKEFNKLSAAQRAVLLKKGFGQDWLKEMAGAQEKSFSGVFSTFEDQMERFLGKVGLPLFKALGKEIQNWNTWIDANTDKVNAFADKMAKAIVGAFRLMKSIAGFFVRHADTLILVAKAWAGYKIGGMMGRPLQALGGGMAGWGDGLTGFAKRRAGGRFGKTAGLLGKFGSGLGKATSIVGKFVPFVGLAAGALGMFSKVLGLAGKSAAEVEVERQKRMQTEFTKAKQEWGKAGYELVKERLLARQQAEKERERGATYTPEGGLVGGEPTEATRLRIKVAEQAMAQNAGAVKDYYKALVQKAIQTKLITPELTKITGAEAREKWIKRHFSESGAAQTLVRRSLNELDYAILKFGDRAADVKRAIEEISLQGYMPKGIAAAAAAGAATGGVGTGTTDEMSALAAKFWGKDADVNVTVQKIEVQSDDPDRFVFGMISAFEDAARNPSSAMNQLREG